MAVDPSPLEEEHQYRLVASDTPVNEDGYKIGVPKRLDCEFCDASMTITEEATPGLWRLDHESDCPNAAD